MRGPNGERLDPNGNNFENPDTKNEVVTTEQLQALKRAVLAEAETLPHLVGKDAEYVLTWIMTPGKGKLTSLQKDYLEAAARAPKREKVQK